MGGPLDGCVAVVAGATRGAGRGIACALGEAGAAVYCAGRSSRESPGPPGRPETIEETAERVDACGGRGIAVRADFLEEEQVRGLFERVEKESGRLDVLVNDIWGGDALIEWGRPFWELSTETTAEILRRAVGTHLIGSRWGVPLLRRTGRGLVVEVTDGDFLGYRLNLAYDLAKVAAIRLAYAMACELEGTGVTALAVTPGFLRSEAMLDHFGVTEETWRDGVAKDRHFAESETPLYVGRAVAALAADPEVGRRAGGVYASGTLAREYGFADADGRRPDFGRYLERFVDDVLEGDSPLSDDERFVLRARRFQLDLRPGQEALQERIAARLRAASE